jgi:PqqD family protein of HPr-rel-A system
MTSCETVSSTTTVNHPLRRTDVRVQELDGEALVFDPVSADTHRLNRTALFIWHECDAHQDASQIASRLTEVYDVPYDRALQCVEHMLHALRQRRLTTEADEDRKPARTLDGEMV